MENETAARVQQGCCPGSAVPCLAGKRRARPQTGKSVFLLVRLFGTTIQDLRCAEGEGEGGMHGVWLLGGASKGAAGAAMPG
ncbi:hypothetical protein ACFXP9_13565 [Paracoccus sp. p1-h21]|uniref:hypothetical protein n=1 Tax=Paracoccus sp. p1-h21 TaxID=3366951 RepID=UPI0037ABF7C1